MLLVIGIAYAEEVVADEECPNEMDLEYDCTSDTSEEVNQQRLLDELGDVALYVDVE